MDHNILVMIAKANVMWGKLSVSFVLYTRYTIGIKLNTPNMVASKPISSIDESIYNIYISIL